MKKLLIVLSIALLSGCSAMKSTHENYNIPVDCSALFKVDNLGNGHYTQVKLTRKMQDRFGKVMYQARSNINIKFAGRGVIPANQLKDIKCE